MTGIRVSPQALAAAGGHLQAVGERLGRLLQEFRAELDGFGAPWGNDDLGSLIGAAHDEVSSWAFECYRSAMEELAAAGEDVAGMGGTYTAADDDARSVIERSGRGAGG